MYLKQIADSGLKYFRLAPRTVPQILTGLLLCGVAVFAFSFYRSTCDLSNYADLHWQTGRRYQ